MELKEFVTETLRQIIDGVVEAQAYAGGRGSVIGYDKARATKSESPQVVEFDVVVTVQDGVQTKGGAGVAAGVLVLGSQAASDRSNQSSSRIRFAVPLYLPVQPKQ